MTNLPSACSAVPAVAAAKSVVNLPGPTTKVGASFTALTFSVAVAGLPTPPVVSVATTVMTRSAVPGFSLVVANRICAIAVA